MKKLADPTVHSATDAGLVAGTAYYYVVEAVDKAGNTSVASNEARAVPAAVGPVMRAPDHGGMTLFHDIVLRMCQYWSQPQRL